MGDSLAGIRKAGVANCILSTDLGQVVNPGVSEGFAMFAQRLLDSGFETDEIQEMGTNNPRRLLEE